MSGNPTDTEDPDEDVKKIEIEYVKLWMRQSQLFWSRLQTNALLHSGVFAGWHTLKERNLQAGILVLGIIVSFFLILIMVRDGQYMESMKDCAGKSFPSTGEKCPKGRACGIAIPVIFIFADIILLQHTFH